jgi:hypothetical protein
MLRRELFRCVNEATPPCTAARRVAADRVDHAHGQERAADVSQLSGAVSLVVEMVFTRTLLGVEHIEMLSRSTD